MRENKREEIENAHGGAISEAVGMQISVLTS